MSGDYRNTRDYDDEDRRERSRSRRRARQRRQRMIMLLSTLLIILAVVLVILIVMPKKDKTPQKAETSTSQDISSAAVSDASSTAPAASSESKGSDMATLLQEAEKAAKMYDYDKAIDMLKSSPFASETDVSVAVSTYEADKAGLKPADMQKITHIFFHSLIVDPAITFSVPEKDNYNSNMCTIKEFKEVLQQMYDKGYVLVSVTDMATFDDAGNLVKGKIMLPPGKIPFVMSEDDVCFYEYMEGDGFATRFVIGEDGRPTTEYKDKAGNVTTGEYDIVPILDHFIDEHPDFSYKGAKAILAFTGYNGILGYRTDETYDPNSSMYDEKKYRNTNIENDRAEVKKVAQALKDDGYEFASHSWGHIRTGDATVERVQKDTDRWERNVEPLLPDPCPILIYPFGSDIGTWHPYAADNEKFHILFNAGFRYFLTVDSNQYFVQYNDNYMRGGRRNIDGYRLYEDYIGEKNRLGDILDVKKVFDTVRPTPITWG